MKPYGIPRVRDLECPDCVDIKEYGMKSSVGAIRHKGGYFKTTQKSRGKRSMRRYWKRVARQTHKKICEEEYVTNSYI